MINQHIKELANKKIPLFNNSSSLYDILDWLRERKFLHIEVLWYPHEWLFVIYKIDDSDPEPYHVASKGCKSYWDCLEAGLLVTFLLLFDTIDISEEMASTLMIATLILLGTSILSYNFVI